jgi:hypothetical protein
MERKESEVCARHPKVVIQTPLSGGTPWARTSYVVCLNRRDDMYRPTLA